MRRDVIDLKEMYREKAEELAFEKYGKEFDGLNVLQQEITYNEAEILVHEDLQIAADSLRDESEFS